MDPSPRGYTARSDEADATSFVALDVDQPSPLSRGDWARTVACALPGLHRLVRSMTAARVTHSPAYRSLSRSL
jgi:hypothetical protein